MDSIIIPSRVEVVVAGISSPGLRAMSCVLGKIPTMGFDIAHFINKYQVKSKHVTHDEPLWCMLSFILYLLQ